MKKSKPFVGIACISVVWIIFIPFGGCTDSSIENPARLYGVKDYDVGNGCCCDTFKITFSDSSSSGMQFYYWIGIELEGKLKKFGDPIILTPPFTDATHYAIVTYLDGLRAFNYSLYVFACVQAEQVGDVSKSFRAGGGIQYVQEWNKQQCRQNCCTKGNKNNYVQFEKRIENVIGVQADILTRYGKLCGQPHSTAKAVSWTYCAVAKQVGDQTKWAQTGFASLRLNGESEVRPCYYAEVRGEGSDDFKWYSCLEGGIDPAVEGSVCNYACSLDVNNGIWKFIRYDPPDTVIVIAPSYGLWTSPGSKALFTGEIENWEDDMAGTIDSQCEFTNLRVRVSGNQFTVPVSYDPGDTITSDDYYEWGIDWEESGGYVNKLMIWDERPLTE